MTLLIIYFILLFIIHLLTEKVLAREDFSILSQTSYPPFIQECKLAFPHNSQWTKIILGAITKPRWQAKGYGCKSTTFLFELFVI